jgi:hypothetical protein
VGEEKLISGTEYLRMLSVWRLQTVIKMVQEKYDARTFNWLMTESSDRIF